MPLRKLPAETLDFETSAAPDAADTPTAATGEIAEAQARAAAARVRAQRLRELAAAAAGTQVVETDVARRAWLRLPKPRFRLPRKRFRVPRPSRKAVAVALIVIGASVVSGDIALEHYHAVQQRDRAAAVAAVARDAVHTMMSIDPENARGNVQRFSEVTTGLFRVGVLMNAENFVAAVQQSKAAMRDTVQAVAVESMTPDSAVVLVTVKSEISRPDQPKPESRWWRIAVNLQREGTQFKIAKFEFVP